MDMSKIRSEDGGVRINIIQKLMVKIGREKDVEVRHQQADELLCEILGG